jgi:hypothetical protein
MKLADSEQLASEEYLYITDSWKQDWEKGVQVPVNEDLKHEPKIRSVLYFIYLTPLSTLFQSYCGSQFYNRKLTVIVNV